MWTMIESLLYTKIPYEFHRNFLNDLSIPFFVLHTNAAIKTSCLKNNTINLSLKLKYEIQSRD